MKIIKEEYGLGTQSVVLKKMIQSEEGLKIKIDIKSDSYDFQSHATVSVFNDTELKWNVVSSIHYSLMKTPPGLFYKVPRGSSASTCESYFKSDMAQLIQEAEEVLGQSFSVKKVPTKKPSAKIK